MISTLIMGSPARRLINPITRCWDHPHYGYAGTDDRRGTDLRLDTKRLTLMSGKPLWDGDAVGRFITQAGSAAVMSVE